MQLATIKTWTLQNLNGLLALIFGFIALAFPALTLATLAIFFAVSILLGGAGLIIHASRTRTSNRAWYLQLIEGIAGLVIGVLVLFNPQGAASLFIILVGLWSIFLGLLVLLTYYNRKREGRSVGILAATSIFFLIIGILIVINPFASTRFLTILIGIYAIAYGIFSLTDKTVKPA